MKRIMMIKYLLGFALAIAGTQAYALVIDPTSACPSGVTCLEGPSGPPANNPSIGDIETLTGKTGLESLYKQNVGDALSTGSFASSYMTTFFPESTAEPDPAGALISYVSGNSISCPDCVLIVKDGSSNPNWYAYIIDAWNGTDVLELNNFWIGQGAISHVEILGKSTVVPEPGTLVLLSLGLLGMGLGRKRLV